MSKLDKLFKMIAAKNAAELIDEEQRKEIAQLVVKGYEVDEASRSQWLTINQEAMKIIKHCEDDSANKNFPFHGAAKVVYPLLAPAVMQLAARMSTHIVSNDKVCFFATLGRDYQVQVPPTPEEEQQIQMAAQQGQQIPPKMEWKKASQARRLTDYASYDFLIKNDTWLTDTHKLMSIVAGWGTAFRQVYYDPISKRPCHDLIAPEDVIINHNITSLDKAPRITIRNSLRQNDIVTLINSGQFLDIDLNNIEMDSDKNDGDGDSRETNPAHEFLCQMLYIDLDDDGYAEPYKAYVHKKREELFGLYPAFKVKHIEIDPDSGKILRIKPRIDVVDYHCIDDPEGKFYSIGLNYLLTHQNRSITSILRQLIDSGTLANTQGGFITKAFKTKEKTIEFNMGEFKVLDCDSTVNPAQNIIPLPFKEPSQVLLSLLQTLIQAGKETGLITDVLTGDVESQNTPATTMLAAVEQGSRVFKPMIQKLYVSLKKEFKLWFEINSEYLDVNDQGMKYATFQGRPIEISKADFNFDEVDVCPVADPTMSSEAHGFAQARALVEAQQAFGQVTNMQEAALRFYTQLQFANPEKLVAQPQQQQPDPKMMELQLKSQIADQKNKIDQMAVMLEQQKLENEKAKLTIKQQEFEVKAGESKAKVGKMIADAHKDHVQANIAKQQADTQAKSVEVEEKKVEVMKLQAQKKSSE